MQFDEAAKTWDDDPVKMERSILLAKRLSPLIKKYGYRTAMDFGAGTGVTSFLLTDELESITLIDSSAGMVEQINEKINNQKAGNLKAYCIDLFDDKTSFSGRFDIIYSLLTMHHILDTAKALRFFNDYLAPGGMLCIADLEEEDGSFHAEYPDFDGHLGFDQIQLTKQLKATGFEKIHFDHFYTIKKEFPEQENRLYPLFLMTAKKG